MDELLYQLIIEAKRGNEEAFSSLVTRYKRQVFRHAFAMVNDRMEAEDISQEAFVKAYFSISKLNNEYGFVSWLTRIVSNLCYDRIKKKEKTVPLGNGEKDLLLSTYSSHNQSQMRMTLQEAMQELSIEYRTVLVLREVEGYSYNEMAEILHIPLGTVKSRLSAARELLKKELVGGD
ncbi:MAG: subfamily polymerase sigma-24 subunit [Bacillus sp. (in: firmicutes)]|nr:subfamily polymerase sigma-24 subunit [Bacillus sp. (in: firmicutes)]